MKVESTKLEGAALDWAVATALGWIEKSRSKTFGGNWVDPERYHFDDEMEKVYTVQPWSGGTFFRPSSNWATGGEIIEKIGGFELKTWLESKPESRCEAHIHNYDGDWIAFGPTPLVAAMRVFVAFKLGDEVEVPDELT